MNIDDKTMDMLEEVSRFDFEPDERETRRGELERTLDFLGALEGIDTADAPEREFPSGEMRFRPDEVSNEARISELLANAPDRKGPYFRVPRTVEE
jgi:aspartyl-tRNA(Asn)/glutamyl-tRNA(Gln) amidotransferase subunit C